MTGALAIGVGLMLISVIYVLDTARRQGPQFEYADALIMGELGLLTVVGQLVSGGWFGITIVSAFGISMLVTIFARWKLFHRWKEQQNLS